MIIQLSTLFGYCSPSMIEFYTYKYPQINQDWLQSQGSVFTSTIASPWLQQDYSQQNIKRLIIVGDSQEYLNVILNSIKTIVKEYQQIIQVLLPIAATTDQYFDELRKVVIQDNDVILLPMINCESQAPQDKEITLYDRTNDFYQGANLEFSRVQTIEQIQTSMRGYRDLLKQSTTPQQRYYDFESQKLKNSNVLIVGSALDTTSMLQFNSLQFCHISSNYHPQTSSQSCFVAVPIGMGPQGIGGTGFIGSGFPLLVRFQLQLQDRSARFDQVLSALQSSILVKNQFRHGTHGLGNGITDMLAIQKTAMVSDFTRQDVQLDVIGAGGIVSGALLELLSFQVLRTYVTIRGAKDTFQPLYENIYETHIADNRGALERFSGLSIYVCQKVGIRFVPHFVGTVNGKHGSYQYVIQSSELWGQHITEQIKVWLSYSQDLLVVSQEVEENKPKITDITISLQFIGRKVDIILKAISDVSFAAKNVELYFVTDAIFVYSTCIQNANFVISRVKQKRYSDKIMSVKFSSGKMCNIYFCSAEQRQLNHMNSNCAKSQPFSVEKFSLLTIFTIAILIGLVSTTYQYIILTIFHSTTEKSHLSAALSCPSRALRGAG
ncbi:hypothetical protein SS50377_26135 [Spironucleus salmonicida]|uniref:Uncharacterized protein n=1 Tax=Spironucleus salmonicida TaxID=348837 RepID=V6LRL9_9EUKA|nr:hypothetical protein SS50377_26135 [Spironucleus salmonicida]|eukprot:EST46341.1 Hypothetical protein SS50377_13654 [Spironucleus salmonicida]